MPLPVKVKAVERLRYYIERDVIICVLVRDVVDISMELNEIKAVMTLAAEHEIGRASCRERV